MKDLETLQRIEGLVSQCYLESFKQSIQDITDELENEGFELSDVQMYLHNELYKLLGDQ